MKVLVVRDAFGDYAVGEIIREPAAQQSVRDAGQAHFCTAADIDESFFAAEAPPAKGKAAAGDAA